MRALLLIVLAGCFDPQPRRGLACEDWCPPPEQCYGGTCALVEPNIAFVTELMTLPANLTASSADSGCRTSAMMAGLDDTFVAWFSSEGRDARDQLAGASGWQLLDGRPLANTVDDIIAGTMFYPLAFSNARRDLRTTDINVGTATRSDGTLGDGCGNGTVLGIGKVDGGREMWTATATLPCADSTRVHVYCFGIDRRSTIVAPPIPPGGKRAFVTRETHPPLSIGQADALCSAEHPGAVALLPTTMATARMRVVQTTMPEVWYRADGVRLTSDMRSFEAPLEVTIDGNHVRGTVWFGASALDALAPGLNSTCNDWTNGSEARVGTVNRSAGAEPFSGAGNVVCGTTRHHYYCAEP